MMKNIFLLMVITVLASGCNSSSDSKKQQKTKISNPLEGQLKTLEKAKAAQKKLHDATEKQRQAIKKVTEDKKSDATDGD